MNNQIKILVILIFLDLMHLAQRPFTLPTTIMQTPTNQRQAGLDAPV